MKKIGVFTSGGDSPGMNACIRAVVRTAIYHGCEVYGIYRGYEGMIDGEITKLESSSVSNIIQTGGSILKSARSPRFREAAARAQAVAHLKRLGIEGIVAIGGDGTYTGAKTLLAEYPELKITGAPGTIDNDLFGTDYTIGFDTACNTAMRAIDNIRDTATAMDRLFFVEVMGRDAGFITLQVGLSSGAEAVLVPETATDMDALIQTLQTGWKRKKTSSIVIVAEGDDAGGAFEVARKVKEQFDQYDTKVSILGHIQRGGSPTCTDRVNASRLGAAAVEALLNGQSGVAAGLIRDEIVFTPFEQCIKHHGELNPNLLRLVEILAS